MVMTVAAEVVPDLDQLEQDIEEGVDPEIGVGGAGGGGALRRGGGGSGAVGVALGAEAGSDMATGAGRGGILGGGLGGVSKGLLAGGAIAAVASQLKPVKEFLSLIWRFLEVAVAPFVAMAMTVMAPVFEGLMAVLPQIMDLFRNPEKIVAGLATVFKKGINAIANAVNSVLPGNPVPTFNISEGGPGQGNVITSTSRRRMRRTGTEEQFNQAAGSIGTSVANSILPGVGGALVSFFNPLPEFTDEANQETMSEMDNRQSREKFPSGSP